MAMTVTTFYIHRLNILILMQYIFDSSHIIFQEMYELKKHLRMKHLESITLSNKKTISDASAEHFF